MKTLAAGLSKFEVFEKISKLEVVAVLVEKLNSLKPSQEISKKTKCSDRNGYQNFLSRPP